MSFSLPLSPKHLLRVFTLQYKVRRLSLLIYADFILSTYHNQYESHGNEKLQFPIWTNHVPTATLDGGIGLLLPMQEKTYRRLLMLQNALTTMLPHHAGLNPKAFRLAALQLSDMNYETLQFRMLMWVTCLSMVSRMLHSDRRSLQNPVKNILDGELLNKYLYLSTMERSELAKKIGTTQDIVSAQNSRPELPVSSALRSFNFLLPADPGWPSGDRQSNGSFLNATFLLLLHWVVL